MLRNHGKSSNHEIRSVSLIMYVSLIVSAALSLKMLKMLRIWPTVFLPHHSYEFNQLDLNLLNLKTLNERTTRDLRISDKNNIYILTFLSVNLL